MRCSDPETGLALRELAEMRRQAQELRRQRIEARVMEGLPAEVIAGMFGIDPARAHKMARNLGVSLADPRDWYGLDPV